MTSETFQRMVETIYGTFGYNQPGQSVKTVLWDTVNHIPDVAVGFIVKRVKELDTLPRNLGKSILAAWFDWRNANPTHCFREVCQDCGGQWLYVWRQKPDGRWQYAVSPCPTCYEGEKIAPSRQEIRDSSGIIMPTGYPGGILAFDQDKELFALSRPANLDSRIGAKFLQMAELIRKMKKAVA